MLSIRAPAAFANCGGERERVTGTHVTNSKATVVSGFGGTGVRASNYLGRWRAAGGSTEQARAHEMRHASERETMLVS